MMYNSLRSTVLRSHLLLLALVRAIHRLWCLIVPHEVVATLVLHPRGYRALRGFDLDMLIRGVVLLSFPFILLLLNTVNSLFPRLFDLLLGLPFHLIDLLFPFVLHSPLLADYHFLIVFLTGLCLNPQLSHLILQSLYHLGFLYIIPVC